MSAVAVAVLEEPPPPPIMTIAEGKLCAGLDWLDGDARDVQMAGWIAMATAKVQADTGLALGPQAYDVYFDSLTIGAVADLPVRPIRSIEAFSSFDSLGVAHVIADAAFILDGGNELPRPPRVLMTSAGSWPTDLRSFQPWSLRVAAGWPSIATIPPVLRHLVGLLVAHNATVGRDLVQIGHIVALTPMGYDELIAPFRLVVVP